MRRALPMVLFWVAAPLLAAQDEDVPEVSNGFVILEDEVVDRLAVGVGLRLRGEHRNPRIPMRFATASTTGLFRSEAYLDVKANEWLSAYVEVQNRRGPATTVTNAGLQEGWVALTKALDYLDAKAGRFEMAFGSGRMVDPQDWLQAPFTFDGAMFTAATGDLTLAGWFTEGAQGQISFGRSPTFMGFYSTFKVGQKTVLDAYALRVRDRMVAQDVWTYGGRLHGDLANGLLYEMEIVYQRGDIGLFNAQGHAYVFALDYGLDGGHNVGIEWSYASGDNKPWDVDNEVFIPVFPDQHWFNGIADIVAWRNLSDFVLKYWLVINDRWNVHLDFHYFLLPSPISGIFSGPGGAGMLGTGKDNLGEELDVYALGRINEYVDVQVGAAYFNAGSAIFLGENQIWLYAQVAVRF